ncbi:hypothetical protein HYT52_04480 [Candidatus Woesearchaeota archaeon]|nr:hypothetical protein [Candidatus Woesearchaeota archaeon]
MIPESLLDNEVVRDIVALVFSLLGLVVGVILSRIAEEEILPGKKYFYLLKRIIFLVAGFLMSYYLLEYHFLKAFTGNYSLWNLIFIVINLCLYVGLMIFELKLNKPSNQGYWETANYLLLVLSYGWITFVLKSTVDMGFTFVSLIFLYGFPTGTILWPAKVKSAKKA